MRGCSKQPDEGSASEGRGFERAVRASVAREREQV